MKKGILILSLIVLFSGCTSEINETNNDYIYSSIPESIGEVFIMNNPSEESYSLAFSLLDINGSNVDYFGNVSVVVYKTSDFEDRYDFTVEFSKDDFSEIGFEESYKYMAMINLKDYLEYDDNTNYITNISMDINGKILCKGDSVFETYYSEGDAETTFLDNSIFLNEGFYLNGLSIIIKRYGLYDIYGEDVLRIDAEIRNPNPFVIKFYDYESVLIKDGLQYERYLFDQETLNMLYKNSTKEVSYYFRMNDNINGNVTVIFGRSYDSDYREYYHEHKMELNI